MLAPSRRGGERRGVLTPMWPLRVIGRETIFYGRNGQTQGGQVTPPPPPDKASDIESDAQWALFEDSAVANIGEVEIRRSLFAPGSPNREKRYLEVLRHFELFFSAET